MDITPLLDYYKARLPALYLNKTRASATVELCVTQAIADGLAFDVRDAFNLDNAQGEQLDWIAKYIGINRNIAPINLAPWFNMGSYAPPGGDPLYYQYGFTSYDGTSGDYDGIFASYRDIGTSTQDLNDEAFKPMIRLKIYDNIMDGTARGISQYLADWFPLQIVLHDNQDMTLTYTVDDTFRLAPLDSAATDDVLLAYLPRPMGVGVNITRANLRTPYFRITYDGNRRVLFDDAFRIVLPNT